MRNIFLALVLANLAFAAWHFWYDEPEPAATPRRDVPPLTLVREASPGAASATPAAPPPAMVSAPDTAEESAGEAVPPPSAVMAVPQSSLPAATLAAAPERCTTVGPFRELSQAATAAANLRAAGYEPSQRVGEGDIWVGYWVYLERIATETQANEILANLRANGITDSYVIPDAAQNNLVSLGVFSEISRAGRRREEVRALGYEPTVTDRTRRGTVYWVDVRLGADQTLDFDALQTPGRILRLEQRGCPE